MMMMMNITERSIMTADRKINKPLFSTQDNILHFDFYLNNPIISWNYGIALIKDRDHNFVASNFNFSKLSGIEPYNLVGLSDHDMLWTEHSHIYINHEKDILAGHHYAVIEPLSGLEYVNLLTIKNVVYDKKGLPSGTAASAIIFNQQIEYANLSGTSSTIRVSDYLGYNLTPTEAKVLYFLLKGFSRSKVSELSNITKASYDFHLRNIKSKFEVSSVDELVFKCYKYNFHDVAPLHVLSPT